MKLPRPAQSFESQDEWDAYWDDRDDELEGEAQAADDAWTDSGDE